MRLSNVVGFSDILAEISVIIPAYRAQAFIARALTSLFAQSFTDWEAIIVDDSPDTATRLQVEPFLRRDKIRYLSFDRNIGLGAALNAGLDHSRGKYIAYLPSDDVYYRDHLQGLFELLAFSPASPLAFSGVRYQYNKYAEGCIDGYPLQLVQVLHRAGPERWTERSNLESDDLDRLFWHKLGSSERFAALPEVSCEWVDHPQQRHKLMREPKGGLPRFKEFYGVSEPLRFHSSVGNEIDERIPYQRFRRAQRASAQGLKIVLTGELAYNPERVLALEEQGHKLYGLWMPEPYWYNTVGPLPFGNIIDIPRGQWKQAFKLLKPDIIYALLNWEAVPFCHEVLKAAGDIPFVWHFKEGPFICLEKGTFPLLMDLMRQSDGRIYSSPEMKLWFDSVCLSGGGEDLSLVLDGDLPKRDWFEGRASSLLSNTDGEIHTVVSGRPIGLHPATVWELAEHGIHLHFYGDFTHGQWKRWIEDSLSLAPRHLHLHRHIGQSDWVEEFSRYDAGWLHFFESRNRGEILRADWNDLNYPARVSTLAAAGLPMLQRDNRGHVVATQNLVKAQEIGLFFRDVPELAAELYNSDKMKALRARLWDKRPLFTFDYHTSMLVAFFQKVIGAKRNGGRRAKVSAAGERGGARLAGNAPLDSGA